MESLREQFLEYGGDYDGIMSRFMGNKAIYLKFLNMLPQDDSMDRLDAALSAGDLVRAFEAAHTLKGVAGNLGLEPLYRAACAILEPLRAGERRDYTPLHQVVRAEYRRARALMESLREE